MTSSQIAHHRVELQRRQRTLDANGRDFVASIYVIEKNKCGRYVSWYVVKLWMKAWLGSYEGVHCKMAQVMRLICSMDGGGKHPPWEPMPSYYRWFPVLPELLGTLSVDCMYCRNCHSHPGCTSARLGIASHRGLIGH